MITVSSEIMRIEVDAVQPSSVFFVLAAGLLDASKRDFLGFRLQAPGGVYAQVRALDDARLEYSTNRAQLGDAIEHAIRTGPIPPDDVECSVSTEGTADRLENVHRIIVTTPEVELH